MKKRLFSSKELLILSIAGFISCYTGNASASAFQLLEENGVGVGDFDAGGAAIANDASTGYYNPAGLVRLDHQQIMLSGDSIFANTTFNGKDTWASALTPKDIPPPIPPSAIIPPPITFRGSADGSSFAEVPAFGYAAPITDWAVFGFNFTVPFGLATEYADDDFTRYNAISTELSVIDLSPSVGFKITNQWSVGIGVDAEKLNAELDSVGGLPSAAAAAGINPNSFDTISENHAADWGYGWHGGVLFQLTPQTRFGLAYHSQVVFHPSGTSTFEGPLANTPSPTSPFPQQGFALSNNTAHTNVTMPGFTTLSAYQDLTQQWALYGSVNYTQWNVIKNITLQNVEATELTFLGITPVFMPTTINVNLPQNFRNTWRVALGSSYQINPMWLVRAGVGYDESPVNSTDRNIRLPDGNRIALAVGAHLQATHNLGIDAGYTHLFIQDVGINNTAYFGQQLATTVGSESPSANLVGVQLTYDII